MEQIDEKDKDYEFSKAPPKVHTILCKNCNKQKRTLVRYTRLCSNCRFNREVRHNTDMIEWANWEYLP